MVVISLLFFAAALIACAIGFGWVTGKPVQNSKFIAVILTAFLFGSLFNIALSIKLSCPVPDQMLDLECLKAGLKTIW
jgi:hypothetical protein